MLFTRIEFFGLLLVVLAGCAWLPSNRARKLLLLAASYYFYAFWDWRFLGLLLISTVCDYLVGLGLERRAEPRERRVLLATSLVVNLGILGFYKYFDFFVVELSRLTGGWDPQTHVLGLVLPIGISFYTFQTLSYTLDVYRRELPATRSPLDFALFVAFFPQLVAGPIVRASEMLPQLAQTRRPSRERLVDGAVQFSQGFFKKVFLADRVAPFVDAVFADAGAFDAPTTWLALTAYAVQIYCDFSGYSDMAIGTARMLGYDFAENFRHPYLARSLSEFWRRWHISLSTWLRDYLYRPLGGNRRGRTRTHRNLMITMLLGGLWHGAALHFVVWGLWHGVGLAIERALRGRVRARRTGSGATVAGGSSATFVGGSYVTAVTSWTVTTLVVWLGWAVFRAESLPAAGRFIGALIGQGGPLTWIHPFAVFAIALVAIRHLTVGLGLDRLRLRNRLRGWELAWGVLLIGLCFAYPPRDPNPFLYFQF